MTTLKNLENKVLTLPHLFFLFLSLFQPPFSQTRHANSGRQGTYPFHSRGRLFFLPLITVRSFQVSVRAAKRLLSPL